tara:strand:+ start:112 stop:1122 length:1011 start_codon:yes stop_codon:yes gene_type:complete
MKMKNEIDKLEEKYINSFKIQTKYLKDSYDTYLNETDLEWWKFNEDSKELTVSIINRLKAYYNHGNDIKDLLDKNKLAPASDFFVEQVAFFVKLYLSKVNPGLVVCSERTVSLDKGYIIPDISIWNDKDELVSIIECKTQLGFNRKNWYDDFISREKKIPNTKCFYMVMTNNNWDGLADKVGEDYKKTKQFFCLLKDNKWPNEEGAIESIDDTIEGLLLSLKKLKKCKERDDRLVEMYKCFATEKEKREKKYLKLKTYYLGKKYKVQIDRWGRIKFQDEWYSTPNLLYNKGVKLFANPDLKGTSGKNSLSQFYYKEVKLNDDIDTWEDLKSKIDFK